MNKETDSMSKDNSTPKWLKTIQLNSWEAELLISALVLYALFQIPDFIQKFSLQTFERGSYGISFSNIIIRAVGFVKLGYVLHIIVRGIWVSSIGLSYVFPKGIQNENLKFKGKFKKEVEKSSGLIKNVLKLEELSSLIYGISFIGFGCLVGTATLMLIFVSIGEFMSSYAVEDSLLITIPTTLLLLLFILSTLIVFIDFITSGLFRRKKWSVKWFYPIAWVYRILTLSFLYRKSILVLQSNVKGWKRYFIPIMILTFIIGFIWVIKEERENIRVAYFTKTQAFDFQSVNYESKRGANDVLISTIQSDIIDENVIQIYLKDLRIFSQIYPRDTANNTTWFDLNSQQTTKILNKWISVKIDSTEVNEINWRITQHPVSFQYGFNSYLDISMLANGNHIIQVELDTTSMKPRAKRIIESSDYNYQYFANIPFYLTR